MPSDKTGYLLHANNDSASGGGTTALHCQDASVFFIKEDNMKFNTSYTSRIFVAGSIALLFAQAANADSANTITFKGEVTEQTCEVTVNGVNARPVVLLPSVAKSKLAAAASSAGLTAFTLGVTGCTVDADALNIKTVFVANNMTERGNIANTGTAQNVELQLMTNSAGTTPVDLRNAGAVAGITVAAGSTTGEHDFAVQYFSPNGSAKAGTVVGTVQYAVSYL
jgi:major type 1 subunit fimbrin (pilin)